MSFTFKSLTAEREGVVLYANLSGELPNPAHQVSSATAVVDLNNVVHVSISTKHSGGFAPQVISRVNERLNLGRMGPGSSKFVVTADGIQIASGRFEH